VGEVLLKDKVFIQSAPDICTKLQKVVAEGERSLNQLVQLATSVYYNQDLTKKRDKDKKHQDLYRCTRGVPHLMGPHSQDMLPMWTGRTPLEKVSKRRAAWETTPVPSRTMPHM
jgi:hypothetical protein